LPVEAATPIGTDIIRSEPDDIQFHTNAYQGKRLDIKREFV
jgi:hypothetical protein